MPVVQKTIAILGAGVIGRGVAQICAQSGYHVALIDSSAAALTESMQAIMEGLRLQRLLVNAANDSPEAISARIVCSTSHDALRDADVIIENISEDWAAKRTLHEQISGFYRAGTLLAINSSVISITRIAAVTRDPGLVVGIHFMNPVPLTAGVEVVRGFHTSSGAIAQAVALAKSLGKEAVIVNDSPGFVSNRVLMLMINEAIWTVQDQIAQPCEVDRIFKLCFGHKMGPLETADLIGLDTVLLSLDELHNSYRDPKFRACTLLRKMVDSRNLGRKSGRGFYGYDSD